MKLAFIAFVAILGASASAQWTVVNLHPAGATSSFGFGVGGGQQVGYAYFGGGSTRASLWTGTAGSWVNLNPIGVAYGDAMGVSGGQQVGHAQGSPSRASLWTGTAGSWVDLHPAGSAGSRAYGTDGVQQVGAAEPGGGGPFRASLWTGTAGSWVSLHPAGATGSTAYDAHGGQQVGEADVGGVYRASLWTGTAGSWVDLHPAGATSSYGYGVHNGQQAGSAQVSGSGHASLWTSTAASWVDLHPAGATSSWADDVHGGQQVGAAEISGVWRAGLWSSSAGSWVDFYEFLPAGFNYSSARGISHDGDITSVVGYGFNSTTGREEALMWVSRAVAPTSFSMFRGTVFSGNLASLINSDGNKLVMRPGVVLQSSEPPVQVRINSTAPTGSPNGISFSVESSASFAFAQQKISLWNYDTGAYELLDTRVVTTSDDTVIFTVRTNAQRFIDNGTLAMRALVSYRATGPTILYPWSARIDKVWWTFPG